MATAQGQFSGRSQYYLRLDVSYAYQSIPGNYSVVNWSLQIIESPEWGTYSLSPHGSWAVNIGGNGYSGGGYTYDFRGGVNSKLLGSGQTVIYHDAAGNGGVSFSGSSSSGSTLGSASTGGGYLALPFIPKAPATPAAPTLTPGPGTIAVSWTAPSNGGSAITSYTVQYSTNSNMSGALTKTASGTSTTLTGLTFGQTYYVRVRANNAVGSSAYSAIRSAFVGIGGKRWDGSAQTPFATAVRWDGTKEVPITVAVRWDGTQEVPLS